MNDIITQVASFISRHRMVPRSSRVLVAVSGGPDSVALLHILDRLKSDLGISLCAAHLDHALRDESPDEARFVKGLCESLSIPIRVEREDVRALAAAKGMSIEEAGRSARYRFLEDSRLALDAGLIATAHHKDDEVETFVLRLFQGASLSGLGGIPAVRGQIIRPLLGLTRSDIVRFLAAEGIASCVDPTNLESNSDRNFLRNRLFPLIRERFPTFEKPVSRTIDLVRSEEACLDELARQLFSGAVEREGSTLALDIPRLIESPTALTARVIVQAYYEVAGAEARLGRAHVDAVMDLMRGPNPSGRLDLPSGVVAGRQYDRLLMKQSSYPEDSTPMTVELAGPGSVDLQGTGLTLVFRLVADKSAVLEHADDRERVVFDADIVQFPLTIRSALPGDRIAAWNMDGRTKVKNLFIDAKIPRDRRASIPLLVMDDEVLWVVGLRRSRIAPVTESTRRVLEVSIASGENPPGSSQSG